MCRENQNGILEWFGRKVSIKTAVTEHQIEKIKKQLEVKKTKWVKFGNDT